MIAGCCCVGFGQIGPCQGYFLIIGVQNYTEITDWYQIIYKTKYAIVELWSWSGHWSSQGLSSILWKYPSLKSKVKRDWSCYHNPPTTTYWKLCRSLHTHTSFKFLHFEIFCNLDFTILIEWFNRQNQLLNLMQSVKKCIENNLQSF